MQKKKEKTKPKNNNRNLEKFKSKRKMNRKRKKKEEALIENVDLHAREIGKEKQEKKINIQMLSDHLPISLFTEFQKLDGCLN